MWETDARFCPMCAATLHVSAASGRERPRCAGCGFVLYKNPASASAALVLRGGDVLLVRRGIAPFKGMWGLPAGYQEYDEDPETTVVRETREEAGIAIRIERLFAVLYTEDDPRKRANLIAYLCTPDPPEQELCAGDDACEAQWFPLARLPPDIAFRNNRTLLARLRAERGITAAL